MTMPWTPNTCPNTLALRMPCPSPLFRSLCKTKTTAEHGMSHQHRWSDTHYNVTRAVAAEVGFAATTLDAQVEQDGQRDRAPTERQSDHDREHDPAVAVADLRSAGGGAVV